MKERFQGFSVHGTGKLTGPEAMQVSLCARNLDTGSD